MGRTARTVRRSLLVGAAVVLAGGLVLRGSPPSPAVVADDRVREPAAGDVLRPWGTLPDWVDVGSGVAVGGRGEVLLLHRGGAPFAGDEAMAVDPVVVLDPASGRVAGSWGAGAFRSPHGVSVDGAGRVWVADVSTNLVTVHDGDGRLVRRIGHDYPLGLDTCLAVRNTLTNLPCTGDPEIFARPTDAVVTADGHAAVADGYRNSRVARFDPAGRFTGEWGELGDGDGEFAIPHGICALPDGAIAVADRRNARVQVFAADGAHRATFAGPDIGRPYDVATGPGGVLYVLDGGDALDEAAGQPRGHVVAVDAVGTVTRRWSLADQSAAPHQLAVGPAGQIYVAALTGPPLWRWAPR